MCKECVRLSDTPFNSSYYNHPKLHKRISNSPPWLLLNSTLKPTLELFQKTTNKGWMEGYQTLVIFIDIHGILPSYPKHLTSNKQKLAFVQLPRES